jgi:hypothetical protein
MGTKKETEISSPASFLITSKALGLQHPMDWKLYQQNPFLIISKSIQDQTPPQAICGFSQAT